jgi:hypothetical protein
MNRHWQQTLIKENMHFGKGFAMIFQRIESTFRDRNRVRWRYRQSLRLVYPFKPMSKKRPLPFCKLICWETQKHRNL